MTEEASYNGSFNATLDYLMEGLQLISFEWRYLYLNDAVVKHSKYTKDDLLGCTMMEKYPGIELTPMFAELELCMTKRLTRSFENEFTYPDGSKGWFELRVEPVPEGIFILSVDIDERKKAEMERAEYLKSLEEVIFMTSHRVRQPVSQILGYSHLLKHPVVSQDDLRLISNYMKHSAQALDTITRDLNDLILSMKLRAEGAEE